jgi:hypothetical protein
MLHLYPLMMGKMELLIYHQHHDNLNNLMSCTFVRRLPELKKPTDNAAAAATNKIFFITLLLILKTKIWM